ncbi:MAG: pentapeptide repeat-containing protein [Bdellovibrionales bacterium]|nr:pentapeptide repeat-containing protein [Bdellovibrionales bacterium]
MLSCQQISAEVDFLIEPEVYQVNLSSVGEESSEPEISSLEGEKTSELQLSSTQYKSKCNITNYKDFVDDFRKVDKIVRETGCSGKECIGKGCQLAGADFKESNLRGFIFNEANLRGANFKMANIDGAVFTRADLTGANLETNLEESGFRDALLENATYDSMLRIHLAGWRLGISSPEERGMVDIHQDRLAKMREIRGEDCDVKNYLTYTPDLTACNLEYVDFSNQDLSDFIFNYANLRGADFKESNLRKARFKGADIFLADFRSADLTGANLETNLFFSFFGRLNILYSTATKLEEARYDSRFRVTPDWLDLIMGLGIRGDPEEKGMIDSNPFAKLMY